MKSFKYINLRKIVEPYVGGIFCVFLWLNAIVLPAAASELPEILRGMAPSGSACKRDDILSSPKKYEGEVVKLAEPDFSCGIFGVELDSALSGSDVVLMDLRPKREREEFYIKESLNLTASELRIAPYWKGRFVVLVGNGKAEHELYRECSILKKTGYRNVRVLRGGMPQWLAMGRSVIGVPPPISRLVSLSPLEFWVESQNPHNLVVIEGRQNLLADSLPRSVSVSSVSIEEVVGVVERNRKGKNSKTIGAIVLAAGMKDSSERIEELRNKIFPTPVLVYADTVEALTKQLAEQNAIWTAHARGPKRPACGS